MDNSDRDNFMYFKGFLYGVLFGTQDMIIDLYKTDLISMNTTYEYFLHIRTCDMSADQLMRITKRWCDNNPDKTHLALSKIMLNAFYVLPISENCE